MDCPWCDKRMVFHGSVGVSVHDDRVGELDAQADRFDCPNGHSALIVETARIEYEEG